MLSIFFAAVIIVSLVTLALYRLYLHPLAQIPGPKLAALTGWYEFYYECLSDGGGKVAHCLKQLHKRYGPIVRLNPWEVHVDDPVFYEEFYSEVRLDKDPFFFGPFGSSKPMFVIEDSQIHRIRRGVIASAFTMSNVRKLEPAILSSIRTLLDHLDVYRKGDTPANLSDAFRCFSADTANMIAMPKPRLQLQDPNFANALGKGLKSFAGLIGWDRHFKIVFSLVKATPEWLVSSMDQTGETKAVVGFFKMFIENAELAVQRSKSLEKSDAPMTVLDTIIASPRLGPEDKTVARLTDEANSVSTAGTETLGQILSAMTFNLLTHPELMDRLKTELNAAAIAQGIAVESNTLLGLQSLETLPYLQACINETLRHHFPVSSRSPRINKVRSYTYTTPSGDRTYFLPAGTVISMSQRDLYKNPALYADPEAFRPERWLDGKLKKQTNFLPFGKASRNCIGIELAKVELTLMAGNFFRKVDMELYETTVRDFGMAYDNFACMPPKDSVGLRVVVK